ncbi:MAG: alpha-amylase family glycosyl hydrolase, partial [Lachnospiraceae bacterium]|nr:alpha-amylase family glycosyl hydrolase [Lachnospiraceae bacterium]
KYILDVMAYWIEEFHIDGWRLDVADEVDEGVWEEARLMMTERYPNTMLLGETWGSGLSLMNGRQMDAIMNYVFRDAVRDYVAAGKIDARQFMDRSMHMLSNYPEAMDQAMFLPLDSHDTERFLTLCGGDLRKHRAAVTLQMTFVGSPSIYYGDEIGMDGENDPDCRKCMNWDHPDEDLKLYYQELIWIRHQHEALRLGRIDIDLCEGRNLAYTRSLENESITVLIHADNSEEEVRIPVKRRSRFVNLLDGEEYVAYSRDHNDTWLSDKLDYQGELVIPVTPYGVKVLKEESYEEI